MEAQTIAIITPVLTGIGLVIAGGIGWGKLCGRLNTIEKNDKKLTAENGRSVYVTRTECGEDQNKIVIEIAALVKRIDDRDRKQDEKWTILMLHVGKVDEFMRQTEKK